MTSPPWWVSIPPRCSAPPPSTTCCTPSRSARYLVSVCTNIACLLNGALELLEHAESNLGVGVGGTTADGVITLEEAECLADCDRPPVRAGQPPVRRRPDPGVIRPVGGRPAGRDP